MYTHIHKLHIIIKGNDDSKYNNLVLTDKLHNRKNFK